MTNYGEQITIGDLRRLLSMADKSGAADSTPLQANVRKRDKALLGVWGRAVRFGDR